MRLVFALALTTLVLAASATSMESAFAQLRSGDLAKSQFAQELVSTLEMKSAASPVEEVLNLLNSLGQDVVHKQQKADAEHKEKNEKWNAEIKSLNSQIRGLKSDISALTNEIGRLSAALVSNQNKLANLKTQLRLLGSKRKQLVASRASDLAHYKKRSAEQTAVAKALTEIIQTLSERVKGGKKAFIQKSEILSILQKVGAGNPFAALVEFTMSFDVAEVNHVIAKLTDLLKAVDASILNDAELEAKSTKNFNQLISEMNNVHHNLVSEIAATKAEIAHLEATLTARRRTLGQKKALLKSTEENLVDTHHDQDSYNATYAAETKERTEEVETIDRVKVIIKQHSGAINASAKLPTKF